jgi:protein phosphatase
MKGDAGSFQDSGLVFHYACFTDKGCVREINEDGFLALPDQKVFAVADGVGGLDAGEIASEMALAAIQESLNDAESQKILKYFLNEERRIKRKLKRVIDKANEKVYRNNAIEGKKSATTLIMAVFNKRRVAIAHVGDSRAYLFRGSHLSQLTTDHTIAQELVARKLVASASEKHFQYNNVITRAIGAKDKVEADHQTVLLHQDDYILLCSDGLTSMVDDSSIERILQQRNSLEKKSKLCIEVAKQSGGRDNITVVIIHCQLYTTIAHD